MPHHLTRRRGKMTDANWPNPKRPGVPMFPERDGWHWVATQGNAIRPLHWSWKSESWCASADPWASFWKYTDGWSYIGPCFTPTQIAELLAGERERCAKECDEKVSFANHELRASDSHEETRYWTGEHCAATFCADAIRGLGGKA